MEKAVDSSWLWVFVCLFSIGLHYTSQFMFRYCWQVGICRLWRVLREFGQRSYHNMATILANWWKSFISCILQKYFLKTIGNNTCDTEVPAWYWYYICKLMRKKISMIVYSAKVFVASLCNNTWCLVKDKWMDTIHWPVTMMCIFWQFLQQYLCNTGHT